jgi:hypothetical protein
MKFFACLVLLSPALALAASEQIRTNRLSAEDLPIYGAAFHVTPIAGRGTLSVSLDLAAFRCVVKEASLHVRQPSGETVALVALSIPSSQFIVARELAAHSALSVVCAQEEPRHFEEFMFSDLGG